MWFVELIIKHNVIISIFTGLVSCFLSIIFPVFLAKKQKPKYAVKNQTIITNSESKFEGLEVLFYKKPIENLTLTRLYFWNAGNKSIRKRDTLIATPISLSIPKNIDIYKIEYISTKDLSKTLEMKENSQSGYEFSFDAMQKHDGVCFKILHSGKEDCPISIDGKLDGQIKIEKSNNDPDFPFNYYLVKMLFLMVISFASMAFMIHTIINRISLEASPYLMSFTTMDYIYGVGIESNEFVRRIIASICLLILTPIVLYKILSHTPLPSKLMLASEKHENYKILFILEKTKRKPKNVRETQKEDAQ